MKILHAADIHACRDRWAECSASLDTLAEAGHREAVDLFALSGDLAHGPLQDSERDIFDALCAKVQALADIAPVALIYGTPTHDAPGSLEVFARLQARHPIVILRPGKVYYFGSSAGNRTWKELRDFPVKERDELLLFGIPEPSKKWLLAEAEATGKDDSDRMARDAMRALCLGLGGIRQQHSDLPCLVLYHGEIAGAQTATGYQSEVGTGLALSRDELAAIGATYYALGHIHNPQQVGDLPAFYAGSAYPIDWGETHKAGANLVQIEEYPGTKNPITGEDRSGCFVAQVSRVPFPHPQRVKLSRHPDDSAPLLVESFAGRQVWLEMTATREEAAELDADRILSSMLEDGALPGSRVTLNVLPTETVRAGEIVEKKRLRDKVLVYGEASAITIPETVLAKADELERDAAARGEAGQGAHIRIDRLRLKGAIGIWKKSKKDEIDLDLEGLGSGVLALVGANGYGKTTILENLHPWPCMLTRDGKLADHFRLKDSARDLYFTDMRTGFRYRALISIRADIASNSAEYYLWRDSGDGQGLVAVEGVTGRKEAYEAAIGQLFGSLAMYLQTAFVTQRPNKYAPELSQATQGERKALFAELAGIDYLSRYAEAAKARGDVLDSDLLRLEATIAAAADVDEALARAASEIDEAGQAQAAAEQDAAGAAERGRALSGERDQAAARVTDLERRAARASQVDREIIEVDAILERIRREVEGFTRAAEGRGAAQAELDRIAAFEVEAAGLRAEKAELDELERRDREEFRGQQDDFRAYSQHQLLPELEKARKAQAAAEKTLAVARARLPAPVADTCPTCGQTLPEDRLEVLRHAHSEAEAEVSRLEAAETAAAQALSKAKAAYEANAREFSELKPPMPRSFPGAARLAELNAELDFSDAAALRETMRAADEAAVRIDEAGRRRADAETRRAALTEERATLGSADELTPARASLAAKEREVAAEVERYRISWGAIEAAKARAQAAARAQADAEKRRAARDEAAAARDAKACERDDWRLLERAVGPNGIQALELDALSPSIAAVSNGLLSAAYGSRYQIEFRTTRIAGKGSKTKQVEDFEIYVLDTETGDEQTIDSLSGGEAVWIRKALYDGFAIIRARNTGTQFLTAFLDEADGALDPEARMLYLRMLEAAHRESGRYQTILVTHSKELQAMVERTIDVARLGPREVKTESEVAA